MAKADEKLLIETKELMIKKYPRFASEIAKARLSYRKDLPYHSAATDGQNIYFDPDFMLKLTEDERLFIIAHELMHVKFEHMYRIKDKDGNMRDSRIWNIATDAIINANLERDGFKIPEGAVNIPEALKYNSEQMYDKLMAEMPKQNQPGDSGQQGQGKSGQKGQGGSGQSKQQDQQNQQNQNNNTNQQDQQSQQGGQTSQQGTGMGSGQNATQKPQQGQGGSSENNQQSDEQNARGGALCDDHSLWEEALKNKELGKTGDNGQKAEEKQQKENSKKASSFREKLKDKLFNKDNNEQNNKDKENQQDNNQDDNLSKNKNSGLSSSPSSSKQGGYDPNNTEDNEAYTDSDDQIIEREAEKFNERNEFEKNRAQRHEIAKKMLRDQKEKVFGDVKRDPSFENLGKEKAILDWKTLLKKEYDKDESTWSQRRAVAENNYAYRIMDMEKEEESVTEVMIDVSGSVSESMVKSFLRQLKPIVKESKLKVGFFADRATTQKEFQEVKTDKDIDRIHIIRPGGGTNMDAAVRGFSKDPKVNKIVFTDGYDGIPVGQDLKDVNVIWLVYENRNYKPCCGKVIQVYPKDLKVVNAVNNNRERDL